MSHHTARHSSFLNSLLLAVSVLLTLAWVSHPLSSTYTLQLIGVFVIIFFFNHLVHHYLDLTPPHRTALTFDSIVFTLVTLLLVATTGGLASPLFFLIYLLLFAVSLMFHSGVAITYTLIITLFFLFLPTPEPLSTFFIKLFSILLIAPLAILIGREYLKSLEKDHQIMLLKKDSQHLQKEETNALMWLSLDFRHRMRASLGLLSQIAPQTKASNYYTRRNLTLLTQNLKSLLKSGLELERILDTTSDDRPKKKL